MSARDDLLYRITRHCSAETAAGLVDGYRDEVRTAAFLEAADEIDSDDDCGCGGCGSCVMQAAAARLRVRAREKSSRKAEATPALLRAHASEVRRQDAARLLAERRRFLSRAIFCEGIKHAAARLTEWADDYEPSRATSEPSHATNDTPGEGT